MTRLIVSALGIGLLTGCPQAGPVVQPVANLAACVASDALKGDSIAQIAVDCGSDVPAVIGAILNATDQGVLASKAHDEAIRTQTMMLSRAKASP